MIQETGTFTCWQNWRVCQATMGDLDNCDKGGQGCMHSSLIFHSSYEIHCLSQVTHHLMLFSINNWQISWIWLTGSAVVIEWIFSSGQDTISLYHASLNPDTIHTLMLENSIFNWHAQLSMTSLAIDCNVFTQLYKILIICVTIQLSDVCQPTHNIPLATGQLVYMGQLRDGHPL